MRREGDAMESGFFDFQILRCCQLNHGIVFAIRLQSTNGQVDLWLIRFSVWLSIAIDADHIVGAIDNRYVYTFSGSGIFGSTFDVFRSKTNGTQVLPLISLSCDILN